MLVFSQFSLQAAVLKNVKIKLSLKGALCSFGEYIQAQNFDELII